MFYSITHDEMTDGGGGYVDTAYTASRCTLLIFQDINHDIPPARHVQEMKMVSCDDGGLS